MKTKALALARGTIFISTISFVTLLAFVVALTPAHAASVDYYIKIDDIDGESKETEADRTTNTAGTVQSSGGSTGANAGIEPDEIDYDGKQETNFGVLLDSGNGGGDDDSDGSGDAEKKKGNVEYGWKVEEGESATDDDSDDRLKTAGPVDGWPTEGILIKKVEVRGWNPEQKQEFLAEVKAFAEIQSGQDLENFAKGVLVQDESIEAVEFEEEGLQVSYKATGKLFGFIPVTFTERVVATDAEGEVDILVKLPWYGFLLSPDVDPAETAKEAKDKHKETIEIESWSWGVSQHAALFQTISNVLKTRHDTAKNSVNNIR